MPLAAVAAGLLLLLALTMQALALQERAQTAALERLRREEDLLVSAAHHLLAVLNEAHPCLLALPQTQWATAGIACATPADVVSLTLLVVWSVPVRLLAWSPGADGESAQLDVQLVAGQGRAPRHGRFAVRLTGAPAQAVDLRSREPGGLEP
ncbi:MAG: hypothetical protein FJ083_05270 [Cyanobacteria bacterium K_Offshore_surface_m2_239]|nr:hypothetical protein [Cyanobacteria bacterium K_Offshore_surface_m2_239]